jgi:hypothetical protein
MIFPSHPKTRSYFQRGLFDGLTSFRELESRISGLATKGERGNAFEVFAEAYLATVAVEKAKHVWPGASVPHSLRKRLALTIGDKGVEIDLSSSSVSGIVSQRQTTRGSKE